MAGAHAPLPESYRYRLAVAAKVVAVKGSAADTADFGLLCHMAEATPWPSARSRLVADAERFAKRVDRRGSRRA